MSSLYFSTFMVNLKGVIKVLH